MGIILKVARFDENGARAGEFQLDEVVFGGPVAKQAVHEAVLMQLANCRKAHAKVKGYGETKGGSCKPWKQKHTGRARAGSRRSLLWRGGAVALGPDGRANYVWRLPRKVRRLALASCLRDAARGGRLSIIDDVKFKAPKTKDAVALIGKLELTDKRVLFIIPQRDENFQRSVRNIPSAKALVCSHLNPHDLLHYERIVLFQGAYGKVVEVLK